MGADVKLNVQSIWSKQIKLICSTADTEKNSEKLSDMSKELSEFGRGSNLKMQRKLYKRYLQRKEMAKKVIFQYSISKKL
jgi:hypothetical protein